MFFAYLDTRNFSFVVISDTEENARQALKKAWAKHKKHTGATYTWADLEDAVGIVPATLNQAITL